MEKKFVLPEETISLYQEALAFYRKGEYADALFKVRALSGIDYGWLQRQLLHSYILKAMGDTYSEITVLQSLLRSADKMKLTVDDESLVAEALSLLGSACRRLGCTRKAISAFLESAAKEKSREAKAVELSNAFFTANAEAGFSVEEWGGLYQRYNQLFQGIRPYSYYGWRHDKIRIGYLSHDFRYHAAAQFMTAFFADYDKAHFEVYGYQANTEADEITCIFRGLSDKWREIGAMSFLQAANCIYEDEIDVLVELGGHTEGNCLPVLAWHPAKIQISGIGYMGSTGLRSVDYFLSDRWCIPQGNKNEFFTEKILQLPQTHFCYTPLKKMPVQFESPFRRNGYITFGCFNNFSKVTDEQLRLWREILLQVPSARLILKSSHFAHAGEDTFIQRRLKRIGLPVERIEGRGLSQQYLQEYGEVDIALDTFPYTGGLTTCEALACGVPVISRYGQRHGTRFGLSFLSNIGLPELAAATADGYVERTVALARDLELLSLLRQQLPQFISTSPLMDRKGYMKGIEEVFAELCRKDERCAGGKGSLGIAAEGK